MRPVTVATSEEEVEAWLKKHIYDKFGLSPDLEKFQEWLSAIQVPSTINASESKRPNTDDKSNSDSTSEQSGASHDFRGFLDTRPTSQRNPDGGSTRQGPDQTSKSEPNPGEFSRNAEYWGELTLRENLSISDAAGPPRDNLTKEAPPVRIGDDGGDGDMQDSARVGSGRFVGQATADGSQPYLEHTSRDSLVRSEHCAHLSDPHRGEGKSSDNDHAGERTIPHASSRQAIGGNISDGEFSSRTTLHAGNQSLDPLCESDRLLRKNLAPEHATRVGKSREFGELSEAGKRSAHLQKQALHWTNTPGEGSAGRRREGKTFWKDDTPLPPVGQNARDVDNFWHKGHPIAQEAASVRQGNRGTVWAANGAALLSANKSVEHAGGWDCSTQQIASAAAEALPNEVSEGGGGSGSLLKSRTPSLPDEAKVSRRPEARPFDPRDKFSLSAALRRIEDRVQRHGGLPDHFVCAVGLDTETANAPAFSRAEKEELQYLFSYNLAEGHPKSYAPSVAQIATDDASLLIQLYRKSSDLARSSKERLKRPPVECDETGDESALHGVFRDLASREDTEHDLSIDGHGSGSLRARREHLSKLGPQTMRTARCGTENESPCKADQSVREAKAAGGQMIDSKRNESLASTAREISRSLASTAREILSDIVDAENAADGFASEFKEEGGLTNFSSISCCTQRSSPLYLKDRERLEVGLSRSVECNSSTKAAEYDSETRRDRPEGEGGEFEAARGFPDSEIKLSSDGRETFVETRGDSAGTDNPHGGCRADDIKAKRDLRSGVRCFNDLLNARVQSKLFHFLDIRKMPHFYDFLTNPVICKVLFADRNDRLGFYFGYGLVCRSLKNYHPCRSRLPKSAAFSGKGTQFGKYGGHKHVYIPHFPSISIFFGDRTRTDVRYHEVSSCEATSDWAQPLSIEQIYYAANDAVEPLIHHYHVTGVPPISSHASTSPRKHSDSQERSTLSQRGAHLDLPIRRPLPPMRRGAAGRREENLPRGQFSRKGRKEMAGDGEQGLSSAQRFANFPRNVRTRLVGKASIPHPQADGSVDSWYRGSVGSGQGRSHQRQRKRWKKGAGGGEHPRSFRRMSGWEF